MYRQYLSQCLAERADTGPTDPQHSQDLQTTQPANTKAEKMNHESREYSDEELDVLAHDGLPCVARNKRRINKSDSTTGENGKHRKLILHFDIRNTVLVADSVTNVSVEQALNSFLTGVTWGRENSRGEWQWHSDQLSLTPPTTDTMTYYKYLEGKYVQTTNDRTKLRLATGDFTHSDIGDRFNVHFQNHMELLRWRYPYNPESHGRLTMAGHDGQPYNYIVPSVYKCIHSLVENGRTFAVVFRTYGLDAPNVIRSLDYGLNGNHPGFTTPLNLNVNSHVGLVKRAEGSCIEFHEVESDDESKVHVYNTDRDIYNMLSKKSGISGFRDDVQYWLENSYNHATAKPLLFDPFDTNVHHIFFDDNIRTFEDDSIVDLRIFDSRGAKTTRSLTKSEAGKFDNVCMVQADLIKCIENDNYYLEMVEQCEKNYSTFLHKFSRLSRCVSVESSSL